LPQQRKWFNQQRRQIRGRATTGTDIEAAYSHHGGLPAGMMVKRKLTSGTKRFSIPCSKPDWRTYQRQSVDALLQQGKGKGIASGKLGTQLPVEHPYLSSTNDCRPGSTDCSRKFCYGHH
jgi:hypothetical protein